MVKCYFWEVAWKICDDVCLNFDVILKDNISSCAMKYLVDRVAILFGEN